MATTSDKNLRVAIVGGGMSGLLCAAGLVKAGIHVEVFEQASEFGEVGAGVGLGPNALFTLEQLGVLEAVLARSDEPMPTMRSFQYISCSGAHEFIYDYQATSKDVGLGIYRPSFLEAIIPMLDTRFLHLNKRCVSVSTSTSKYHVLHFADGSTYEADLIIGADGIKSVVRDFVAGRSGRLSFSNSVAYRAVIPTKVLKAAGVEMDLTSRPLCWIGQDKHIITFPIQAQQNINIVVFCTDSTVPIGSVDVPAPWVKAASQEELLHELDWGKDAMIILKEMKNTSKWYLHFLQPLSSFFRQRVVLVGDAAHAMLPHLGAGVGQGFEDVYALCALLEHAQPQGCDLDEALRAYDNIRVPRANMVHRLSAATGDIYEGRGARGGAIPQIREQLTGLWEPVWHHDLKEEVKRAVASVYGRKGYL